MTPSALEPLTGAALWSSWQVDPLALAGVALLLWWYRTNLRRLPRSVRWNRSRTVFLASGSVLWLWTTCGVLQVYGGAEFWVWTVQKLVLLLMVPVLLIAAQPVELARISRPSGVVVRAIGWRPLRVLGNPFVGPILVPLVCFLTLFGPVPGWAVSHPFVNNLLGFALVMAGAMVALPLLDVRDGAASVAVGAAMAVGLLELLTDAIPGIVMRFQTRLSSTYFVHRPTRPWTLAPLSDQRRAGGILWALAELIDLPFLVILFVRWVRTDAKEAAAIDAVLDAERAAREAMLPHDESARDDIPWWVTEARFKEGR